MLVHCCHFYIYLLKYKWYGDYMNRNLEWISEKQTGYCCGVLIDNRADTHICVLEDKYIATKKNLIHALKELFGGLCHVEYVYRITPC